jgi:hypothetical protein
MTITDPNDSYTILRRELLVRIDGNARRRISMKLKTLMDSFGYTATQRVRQASLLIVLETLAAWGIDYRFPNGNGADAYITLSRLSPSTALTEPASAAPLETVIAEISIDEALLPALYWGIIDQHRTGYLARDEDGIIGKEIPKSTLTDGTFK